MEMFADLNELLGITLSYCNFEDELFNQNF